MIGLIYKDFCVLTKTLRFYMLFLCFYFVATFMGMFSDLTMISSMASILVIMMPISAFAYDEQARFDKYIAATPGGRKKVVQARYGMVLILLVFVITLLTLATVLNAVIFPARLEQTGPILSQLTGLLGSVMAALILNSIVLPVCFKVGVEHARVVMMIAAAATVGGIVALGAIANELQINLSGASQIVKFGLGAAVVISVAGFILSYRISRRIYDKKEF